MKKPFDPFDEKHRDKVKRRKSEEVAAEKKAWEDEILNEFRRAMDEFGWPDYTASTSILNFVAFSQRESNIFYDYCMLRKRLPWAMEKLGYVKMLNPSSKDGRFRKFYEKFFAYRKEGAPIIGKKDIEQAL